MALSFGCFCRSKGTQMPSQNTGFEDLLEAIPDALVGVDEAGVIRFVNRQTESMFGYQRDDLIGALLETLVPESVRQAHTAHRERYGTDPRTRPMGADLRLTGRRRDGSEFPVDVALSPTDSQDQVSVIAAVRDMTDRETTRKEHDLMARGLAATEFSGEAIIGITLDNIITSWNPAAERLYGYSREKTIGMAMRYLVPKDRIDEMNTILDQVRDGKTIDHLATTRVRRDQTVFPALLTVSPIFDANSNVIGASTIARDATAQRKALEASQLMSSVIEFSGEAIITSTLDGIITSWNPAAETLYGYTSQEIVGKSIAPAMPRDRPEEIRAILDKVRAGQPVEHYETVCVRKDGTMFPVSLTASPIRDKDDVIFGLSVITRDVTDQRQALELAQRTASIIDNSQDAIIANSLDGLITSWNPAAERMFGWTGQEIIGRSAMLLVQTDRTEEITSILTKIRADQPVSPHETVRVRKDGTELAVSLTASAIHDADGEVTGAAAIVRDLTQIREASERARSMIEASLDSMVSIDPEGIITDANMATVKLTGMPRERLIGTPFSGYFTDPEKAEEIYQRVLAQGSVTDYPLTLRRHDRQQTRTEVLYNASVYRDTRGDVIGVFAAARDVTGLKQAAEYARSLIEAALDPMVTISPQGKITDTNDATARLTGIPRNTLIGTSFSDYFTDPQKAEAIYQRVFESGSITDYPLTVRRHDTDETRTEVLYNASVYRDSAGNVLGVFAAARDVTKLIHAQREAAHQQARELDRLAELERFQRLTVGRELKMIELKNEIEYLRTYGPTESEP